MFWFAQSIRIMLIDIAAVSALAAFGPPQEKQADICRLFSAALEARPAFKQVPLRIASHRIIFAYTSAFHCKTFCLAIWRRL